MNSFTQDIYEVENRARKYICDKLDEMGEIDFATPEQVFEDDEEVWDLPIQYKMGKHGDDSYRIIRVYKDDEGYFAHGIMTDDDSSTYELGILYDLDTTVMAELADIIQKKYERVD